MVRSGIASIIVMVMVLFSVVLLDTVVVLLGTVLVLVSEMVISVMTIAGTLGGSIVMVVIVAIVRGITTVAIELINVMRRSSVVMASGSRRVVRSVGTGGTMGSGWAVRSRGMRRSVGMGGTMGS